MQTTAIYVSTLCIPCHNRCRYCLLSWDGRLLGADYFRSLVYAEHFHHWIQKNRPELSFQFYYGYSMEHPQLLEAIDAARRLGSVGGEFLQFDGMAFRSQTQIAELLTSIQSHGIRLIDLTFYGTRDYHDRFAARAGDFDYMVQILDTANTIGLGVNVGVPVTAENADQLEHMLQFFQTRKLNRLYFFVPHGEGRGAVIEEIRFGLREYAALSDSVKQFLNRDKFKPEQQWLAENSFSVPRQRMLGISLTPENISFFERLSFPDTIAYLEKLDDDYHQAVPSLSELAQRYGDPRGEKFYSERDLYLHYQRRYIRENGLKLYDIHDERQCFSRRF